MKATQFQRDYRRMWLRHPVLMLRAWYGVHREHK